MFGAEIFRQSMAKQYTILELFNYTFHTLCHFPSLNLPRMVRHQFQKYPLTRQFCAVVLGPKFAHENIFLNHEAQNAKKYI